MLIAVVSAGLSEGSSTRMLVDALREETLLALSDSGVDGEQIQVETIELRPLAHAIMDATLLGDATGDLAQAFDVLARADGVIAATPTFNASYSGLFKAFFDVLPEETLWNKPVLLGATGGSVRHSLVSEHALRPLFVYLRAQVAPTAIYSATEDWGAVGEERAQGQGTTVAQGGKPNGTGRNRAEETLNSRLRRAGKQFALMLLGAGGKEGAQDNKSTGHNASPSEINGSAAQEKTGEEDCPDFVPFDQLTKGLIS
ncbi:MAG: NAD(P)H-dependent oxidoreductase [Actinomycetaceae bacterium]|nr:NAD(P)H-dependent oxidoreductase [Actinomycetaceae bacterium]